MLHTLGILSVFSMYIWQICSQKVTYNCVVKMVRFILCTVNWNSFITMWKKITYVLTIYHKLSIYLCWKFFMYMPVQIPVLKKLVGIDYTYCLIYCCAGHIALRLDSYTVVPFLQLHAFMGHGEGGGCSQTGFAEQDAILWHAVKSCKIASHWRGWNARKLGLLQIRRGYSDISCINFMGQHNFIYITGVDEMLQLYSYQISMQNFRLNCKLDKT